jgi:UDP-N-acetylglucosamine 2-epimerase (non-hydrolysing)
MRKRIMVVFGTRPECIKLAPVVAALQRRPMAFDTVVCASGQHRELLDQATCALGLSVDHDLEVMRPGQELASLAAAVMVGVERAIEAANPEWVIIQGDTTTALAAALTASYASRRIAHVEAGLRSGNSLEPFPEEINRRLITRLANVHFAPTLKAAETLVSEGVPTETIHVTGNTIVDAVTELTARLTSPEGIYMIPESIRQFAVDTRKIILVTCHRRESFGAPLAAVCRAVCRIAIAYPRHQIVFPVHLNPNVKKEVWPVLEGHANLHLIEPLTYPAFIYLLSRSSLVLTDSGGIQEEAPTFRVPVLVLRANTERSEGIEEAFAELVGTDEDRIVARATHYLDGGWDKTRCGNRNPYGDGGAAERIADILAGIG